MLVCLACMTSPRPLRPFWLERPTGSSRPWPALPSPEPESVV